MTGTWRTNKTSVSLSLILSYVFRINKRYYNAGGRPTKEVLEKHPGVVHRVEKDFGVQILIQLLYEQRGWQEWRQFDTIHLLLNHRWYLDGWFRDYPVFNERNIRHHPFAFGEMARHIMSRPPLNGSVKDGPPLISKSQRRSFPLFGPVPSSTSRS